MSRDRDNLMGRAARACVRVMGRVGENEREEALARKLQAVVREEMRMLRTHVMRRMRREHRQEIDSLLRIVDTLSKRVVTLSIAQGALPDLHEVTGDAEGGNGSGRESGALAESRGPN